MNKSVPPAPHDPNSKLVYETEDNPVVRARGFDKEVLKLKIGLLGIFGLLFVPPDDRTKVVSSIPKAFIAAPFFVERVLNSLF